MILVRLTLKVIQQFQLKRSTKMKYKSVEFTKKFNLGNYETQDIRILVEVEENENVDEVFLKLKKKVLEMGGQ